jgi:hypothetical protein
MRVELRQGRFRIGNLVRPLAVASARKCKNLGRQSSAYAVVRKMGEVAEREGKMVG